MTFTRPANHRQLTFEEIAKSAKITVNKVWFLVAMLPPPTETWPQRAPCSQLVSCAPCTGGAVGDEGTLGGAGERQHRRGGQAGSHDVGAASSAGFAAGKGAEPLPFVDLGTPVLS